MCRAVAYLIAATTVFSGLIVFNCDSAEAQANYRVDSKFTARDIAKLKKLAENGDPASQFDLGMSYLYGIGQRRDIVRAKKLVELSATGKYPPALLFLARARAGFSEDIPYKADYVEALKWAIVADRVAAGGEAKTIVTTLESNLSPPEVAEARRRADRFLERH